MRRAGIVGTPRQGIKNTPSRQPEMAEREHGGDPSSRRCESGCCAPRPRSSQRSRRSPELHHWRKRTRRFREKERGDAKKNTTISLKRTGDAASRRPEPVEMRRAGIVGTPRQGIKNTPSRQPEMAEREHGGDPSSRRCESGCCAPRPRSSQRSRRSPELHHWRKRTRRFREKERGDAKKNTTISLKRTGDAASRRPEPVEMRRAEIVGTPRQGIKNTPSRQPEMAEREHRLGR